MNLKSAAPNTDTDYFQYQRAGVGGVKRPGDILSEADTESDTELVTESVTETKALYQSKSLCENQMDVDIADENIKDYKKYDKETKNMLSKAVMD